MDIDYKFWYMIFKNLLNPTHPCIFFMLIINLILLLISKELRWVLSFRSRNLILLFLWFYFLNQFIHRIISVSIRNVLLWQRFFDVLQRHTCGWRSAESTNTPDTNNRKSVVTEQSPAPAASTSRPTSTTIIRRE